MCMLKQAIAVVGYPGAGKSLVGEKLAAMTGSVSIETGDVVRDGAVEYFDVGSADELSSNQLGKYSTMRRREDGGDYVAHDVVEQLENDPWYPVVPAVIIGMRDTQAPAFFEEYFDSFQILWVHAPFQTRLERLQDRGRNGEQEFTESDLKQRDGRENMWGTAECVFRADHRIMNDGDIQDIYEELFELIDERWFDDE